MMWRDVAYLMQEKTVLNSLRKPEKQFSKRLVYCNEKSVRQTEFYQAGIQGEKPEIMIEVRTIDYTAIPNGVTAAKGGGGESHIEYKNKVYRIIRSYNKPNEITELICTSLVVVT